MGRLYSHRNAVELSAVVMKIAKCAFHPWWTAGRQYPVHVIKVNAEMVGPAMAHITPPFLTQHRNDQVKAIEWRGPGRKFQQSSLGGDIADSAWYAISALWKGPAMNDGVTTTEIASIIAIG